MVSQTVLFVIFRGIMEIGLILHTVSISCIPFPIPIGPIPHNFHLLSSLPSSKFRLVGVAAPLDSKKSAVGEASQQIFIYIWGTSSSQVQLKLAVLVKRMSLAACPEAHVRTLIKGTDAFHV